eukprot:2989325-Alexandrium_andersonii.AAC.1
MRGLSHCVRKIRDRRRVLLLWALRRKFGTSTTCLLGRPSRGRAAEHCVEKSGNVLRACYLMRRPSSHC